MIECLYWFSFQHLRFCTIVQNCDDFNDDSKSSPPLTNAGGLTSSDKTRTNRLSVFSFKTLLNVNRTECIAEVREGFEETVTESHGVRAIKARKPAQSSGPQQCLSPGLPLL